MIVKNRGKAMTGLELETAKMKLQEAEWRLQRSAMQIVQ